MAESLRLTIVYEPGGEDWIVASVPEVPGAHRQYFPSGGRTRPNVLANIIAVAA